LSLWDNTLFGDKLPEEEYRQRAVAKVLDHIDEFVADLVDELGDCSSVQRLTLFQNEETGVLPPNAGSILESIATVTGFDVETPELVNSKTLILPQSGWQLYASQTQLVLATRGWWFWGGSSQQETYVVTYGLDNAQATVTGFGSVPGYVLNQYSIDHQQKNGKDYLFFATTTRETWAWTTNEDGRRWWEPRTNSTSQITVLEVPTDASASLSGPMDVVGKVEGLGKPGEQIYSVRFQQDRAFVVTFERTDPFYTIDISNPENPSKVGELEIPGFSSYLHPIGENYILGIGQFVDPSSGRQEGLQISVFDVSDFANPEQIHLHTELSGDGSGSAAEYDPMAFRYLDESGLLILPVRIHDWSRDTAGEKPFDGFKVYKIDPETAQEEEGILEYLSINHETEDYFFHRYCWRRYSPGNLSPRSLVFSGVLWTMKGQSIQRSDLSARTSLGLLDLQEGIEEDEDLHCNRPIPLPVPIELSEPQN